MLSNAKINAAIAHEVAKQKTANLENLFQIAEGVKNVMYQTAYKVEDTNKESKIDLSRYMKEKPKNLPQFTAKPSNKALVKPQPLEPESYNDNPPGKGFVMRKNS